MSPPKLLPPRNQLLAIAVFFLALVGFVVSCENWSATPKAGTRRMGEWKLRVCLESHRCAEPAICFAEASAWCLDAGMESRCSEGSPEVVRCQP